MTTEQDRQTYEKWRERNRQAQAERAQARLVTLDELTRASERTIARMLGKAADNGNGVCRWCGITLGTDDDGNRTHPARRECPGPAPDPCDLCKGHFWFTSTYVWTHECTGKPVARVVAHEVERTRDPARDTWDGGLFGVRRPGSEGEL